jgi:hypothetical protein
MVDIGNSFHANEFSLRNGKVIAIFGEIKISEGGLSIFNRKQYMPPR